MYYNYTIESIIKVIDSETIYAEIDLGFGVYIKRRIKLFGVDAPKTPAIDKAEKAHRKESKKFLKELIANTEEPIYLKSYDVDKYGTVLGEIIINGTSASKTIIAEGQFGYAELQ